jgi:hypothetical protein
MVSVVRDRTFENSQQNFQVLNLKPRPEWAQMWHLWTVFIPRRSITGRLVWHRIWRRHDGRRWIYKRYAAQDE